MQTRLLDALSPVWKGARDARDPHCQSLLWYVEVEGEIGQNNHPLLPTSTTASRQNLYSQYLTLPRCPVELWPSNERAELWSAALGGFFYARWEMCVEKRNHDVQYWVRLRHMLYLLVEVTYIKKQKLCIEDKDKTKAYCMTSTDLFPPYIQ